MFVPHLIPVSRGIFVSTYGELAQEDTTEQALNHLRTYYKHSPFIRVRNTPPRLVDVVGTNFCDLSVQVRGKELVIFAALDNLGKGMVGTAIQNMNLICGLPAHEGLIATALGPS
jgi:N-acetyl-gamma-glutamyl-phosphate reductase